MNLINPILFKSSNFWFLIKYAIEIKVVNVDLTKTAKYKLLFSNFIALLSKNKEAIPDIIVNNPGKIISKIMFFIMTNYKPYFLFLW